MLKISNRIFLAEEEEEEEEEEEIAYRVNYCDKQPTLRVSLVFIYLFIVFLKQKAIIFFFFFSV